jgi:hypothetical protein
MIKLICTAIVILTFVCCDSPAGKPIAIFCEEFDSTAVTKVSLQETKRIKSLDGKFVEIVGVYRRNFEDVALYPSRNADSQKALWLEMKIPDSIPLARLDSLSERKILVIGRINISDKGHLGAYLATLENITCLKAL